MSKANTPISSGLPKNKWDQKALDSRIDPTQKFKRFEAGSPNEQEMMAYRAATMDVGKKRIALVLGMTPEIRKLAIHLFDSLICVDNSLEAINTYSEWLTNKERQNETVLNINWFNIKDYLTTKVSVVYGDGVFANLTNLEDHHKFLELLATILEDDGKLIFRKVVIPRGFEISFDNFDQYLLNFRDAKIDQSEFGFASRILGHFKDCYNPVTCILDNKKVYDKVSLLYNTQKITAEEYAAINRYYFAGFNCIPPEDVWESLLYENGYSFKKFNCFGKDWYRYYIVYQCSKKR